MACCRANGRLCRHAIVAANRYTQRLAKTLQGEMGALVVDKSKSHRLGLEKIRSAFLNVTLLLDLAQPALQATDFGWVGG